MSNDKIEQEDKPSKIIYYSSGKKEYELWLKNDKCHRENDPALIGYYEEGQKWTNNGSYIINTTEKVDQQQYTITKMGRRE